MKNRNLISAVTASLLLIGCGGGGSSSTTSSGSTSTDTGVGYYVDAAVSGVKYKCGEQEGLTDIDGKFIFQKGETCTFKLGEVVLRELNATSLEDNVTIFEDNIEVARLLQTMDRDGNASNGIELLPEAHDVLLEKEIHTVPTDIATLIEIKDALEAKKPDEFNGDIVSEEEVAAHLEETRQYIEEEGLKTQDEVEEEHQETLHEEQTTLEPIEDSTSQEELPDEASEELNSTKSDVDNHIDSETSTLVPDLESTTTDRESEIRLVRDIPLFINPVDETKDSEVASNELLIKFKEGMEDSPLFQELLEKYMSKTTHRLEKFSSIGMGHIKSDNKSVEELEAILKSPEFAPFVESVSKNYIMHLNATNDTNYNELWAIQNSGQTINGITGTVDADMDVAEAWEKSTGSKEVIVAVLDTGVDYTHPDLANNMWQGNVNHGYDFAGDDTGANDDNPMPDLPYDENGHFHGTHVAGTIGAVANNTTGIAGVAQNVSIMALKVFRPDGSGYSSDILEALNYVSEKIDEGENIVAINASYGGGGSQTDTINDVIKELGAKGVVFCAAAGNESSNNDETPVYPASYDAPNIIAVAASDANDNLASFSNYGANSVDVAAPGTNILSTYPDNQYAYLQGTSMATPNVTGTVALLASYYPDATADELKAMIINSVDVKSSLNAKVATNGRVNANEALGTKETPPTNTAPIATNDSYVTPYGTEKLLDVMANDSDANGDELSIVGFTQSSNGKVEQDSTQLLYTPNDGFSGEDSFSYTISDGEANATATVTVTVNEEEQTNTAPVANDDSVKTAYEEAVTFNVLLNDSDANGDKLSIVEHTNPSNGVLRLDANEFTYTPNSGYAGLDNFEYTISDGIERATAKVNIVVEEKVVDDNNGSTEDGDESNVTIPDFPHDDCNETVGILPPHDNEEEPLNPLPALSKKAKYALAYMWNEEKLAHDIYLSLNSIQAQKELETIALRSEIKHIAMVESLVQKYDINITNLENFEVNYSAEELRALPVGQFGIDELQRLYDGLYEKGSNSSKDALEVGCMVEVTDVNDLNGYIAMAKEENAQDLVETFEKLQWGSYNHYWAFDRGLKAMGISQGCCSLGENDGINYCQLDYPQKSEFDLISH